MRFLLFATLTMLVSCGGSSDGSNITIPTVGPEIGGSTGTTTPPPPPPPPVEEIEVSLSGTGAYFSDVNVTVTGPWDGSYEADIGRVKLTDTGLTIRSDGRIGRGTLTIDGKQYYYDIVEDEKCEHTSDPSTPYKIDCFGYETGGVTAPMIWYDNEEVVTIEIGIVRSNTLYPDFENGDRVPDDHEVRLQIEEDLVEWNKMLVRNKVYIEFVLTDVYFSDAWYDLFSFPSNPTLERISDVVYGWGGSGAVGGQALMAKSIYQGMAPPNPVGLRIGPTMQHEVGHAMGLGHGIWGIPDWLFEEATSQEKRYSMGSIFPRFGHGWSGNSGVCGSQGSVMSYSTRTIYSNSLSSCEELGYPSGAWGDAAGSRDQSDEAYALNRVRFSFSLIHNEHRHDRKEYVPPPPPEEEVFTDCPRTGTLETGLFDCKGHNVKSTYPEEGYIFFGDDDTTVVNWEVVLFVFDNSCAEIVDGVRQPAICDAVDKQSTKYLRDTKNIERMNEVLERSGVYVNLDLVDIRYAYFTGFLDNEFHQDYNVDAVLQLGGAFDGVACGWGGFDQNFSRPLKPWGICGWQSLLHELGHTVGLGHGPYNSSNADSGYVFASFGHGDPSVCPGHSSMMAYDVNQTLFSNSLMTCAEITPNGSGGDKPAGRRTLIDGYDEAYSINRVRYDVAEINGETILTK